MVISPQGILIVCTNLLVAVFSTALMLLVLWQAPRQRTNQLFALLMLSLLFFSLVNIVTRFVDILRINPDFLLDLNTIVYSWFFLLLFLFSEEFTQIKNRQMRYLGVMISLLSTVIIFAGIAHQNTRPAPGDLGGYVTDYTPMGFALLFSSILYLVAITVLLRRAKDPRPQAIWPATASIIAGIVLLTLRPLSTLKIGDTTPFALILTLPYHSIGLAIAAIVMARAVLKYQLFDPVHQLNIQLEQANKRLEQADRLKSQFLANMSHELRTPLNSILGYAQLVMGGVYGPVTETQNDRLARVIRNGQSLLGLINDLLDISKIEAGRVVLEPQRVETHELIQTVLTIVEPMAEKKGLKLTYDSANCPAVYVDKDRARQVLVNIVANAVKFTQQGGIRIDTEAEGNFLRFSIADTGIGMPPDALESIFEEFQQVDNSSTREYEGTGLGLTIAKRLVEMHHGRIRVESTLGVGSTFHVTFPLADNKLESAITAPSVVTTSNA